MRLNVFTRDRRVLLDARGRPLLSEMHAWVNQLFLWAQKVASWFLLAVSLPLLLWALLLRPARNHKLMSLLTLSFWEVTYLLEGILRPAFRSIIEALMSSSKCNRTNFSRGGDIGEHACVAVPVLLWPFWYQQLVTALPKASGLQQDGPQFGKHVSVSVYKWKCHPASFALLGRRSGGSEQGRWKSASWMWSKWLVHSSTGCFFWCGSDWFSKGSYPVEYGVLPSETKVLSSATLCRCIGAVLNLRACNQRVRLDGISLWFSVKLGILFVYGFRRWVLFQTARMHFFVQDLNSKGPSHVFKKCPDHRNTLYFSLSLASIRGLPLCFACDFQTWHYECFSFWWKVVLRSYRRRRCRGWRRVEET